MNPDEIRWGLDGLDQMRLCLLILLLSYTSCSKCLLVLARVLTLTLFPEGFRWNITCHGMAQTFWRLDISQHIWRQIVGFNMCIYVYIRWYFSHTWFEPYPHSPKTRSMQWSLRYTVLLLRKVCISAEGCWAECGRSGYYCPEFCCQPVDGGNPSCWDETGIYTFSKCHWVV